MSHIQKHHRNLVSAIVAGLNDILLDKKQADVTVEHLLASNKSWGARDRHFIADNIYHLVRYKRLYEFCIGEEVWSNGSLYRLFAARWLSHQDNCPEWEEFSGVNKSEIRKRWEEAQSVRKIRESIPDWLDQFGEKELGDAWEKEISALNIPAKLCIRINTLKTNKAVIKKLFTDDGIGFSEHDSAPDALIIHSKKNFRTYLPYRNGLFEVQDISSQMVAPALEAKPGMKVIDGCAGAGGKTLHLVALMKNRGDILAVDKNEKKLEELNRRAQKAGCSIIHTFPSEKLTKNKQAKLINEADRILLDVPCSGSGVLRRKPDAKWSLTEKFIHELKTVQAQILDEYAQLLRPGGLMVYSTCSIFPSENTQQVQSFLERHRSRFELVEEINITPSSGFDGFYIAQIKKV